jgi:hypothetical protein
LKVFRKGKADRPWHFLRLLFVFPRHSRLPLFIICLVSVDRFRHNTKMTGDCSSIASIAASSGIDYGIAASLMLALVLTALILLLPLGLTLLLAHA